MTDDKEKLQQLSSDLSVDDILLGFLEKPVDEVQEMARSALNTLFVLLRLNVMHMLNNEAFIKPLAGMVKLANDHILSGNIFVIKLIGDIFFVNNDIVRLDSTSFTSSEYLIGVFHKLGMGCIASREPIKTEEIVEFLKAVRQAELMRDDEERKAFLPGRNFGSIYVFGKGGEADPLLEFKREAQRVYSVLVVSIQDIAQQAKRDRFPPLAKIKRLVQRLIDLSRRNPHIMAALASYWGKDEHHKFRPVNAAVLSLLVGIEIGLDRRSLSSLGMAALLHRIGEEGPSSPKAETIADTINLLTRIRGVNEHTLEWTVAAYEARLLSGGDGSGGEPLALDGDPSLISRILAVVCAYETMINAKTEDALAPPAALLSVLEMTKESLDPSVAKAFARQSGLYPAGTIVELSDGRSAMVVKSKGASGRLSMPEVRLIGEVPREDGAPATLEIGVGEQPVEISRTIPPQELRVNVAAEILY